MLCYRCGNYNGDESKACASCGQPFTSSIRPIQSKRSREGGPFRVGDAIALRYKVISYLGEGPTGFLYRVSDSEPSGGPKDLVLKLLQPKLVQAPQDRAHFEAAVEAASKLQSAGVAGVYGTGEDASRVFVLSEYCHGLSLSQIVELRRQQQKAFSLSEAEGILGPLCRALEQVHPNHVHGALRPANIIVQPDEVNVTDFVSWHGLPRGPFIASLGDEVRYLAPEARMPGNVTPAADVYSLGIILRELLAGVAPQGPPMGKTARALIERATHVEARLRPSTANAFYESLLEAIDDPESGPVVLPPSTRTGTKVPPPTPRDVEQAAERRKPKLDSGPIISFGGPERRSSWRAVSLALFIVLAGLALSAAIVWWRNPTLFSWLAEEVSGTSHIEVAEFDMMQYLAQVPPAQPSSMPAFYEAFPVVKEEPLVQQEDQKDPPLDKKADEQKSEDKTAEAKKIKAEATAAAAKKDDKDKRDTAEARATRDSFGCMDGMVFVPGGRFPMGSSTVDEFHSFSDLALRSVEVSPFCIDRHEYPNQAGAQPLVNTNLPDARAACQSKGKRLCREDEWERACKGPAGSRFPYGDQFEPKTCNVAIDGQARSVQGSGQAPMCRSGFGVMDLAGNVAEWTESRLSSGGDFVVKGGDATHPDYMSRCAHRTGTAAGKKSAIIGVRCCGDPR